MIHTVSYHATATYYLFHRKTGADFQVKLSFPAPAAPYLKESRLILRTGMIWLLQRPLAQDLYFCYASGYSHVSAPPELEHIYIYIVANWDLNHLDHRSLVGGLLMPQTFLGFLRPISNLFVTEGACELQAPFANLTQNVLRKQLKQCLLRSTEVCGMLQICNVGSSHELRLAKQ